MKILPWRSESIGDLTLSSRVPQHGVGHHHDGPLEDVGQDEHVELLQALVHGLVRGLPPGGDGGR